MSLSIFSTVQERARLRTEFIASHRKSQIALEYCFRRRQKQPDCSVFWVNAAKVARFKESFQHISKACDLSTSGNSQEDSIQLVQRWLEAEYSEQWIMVIDNVDDEAAFFREKCRNDKSPSQCLPGCSKGHLLFTSRTRDVAVDLASPARPISVDFITQEEGLQLMRKRMGQDPPEVHLIELLSELEHIPLAITRSIAFILKRRKSVQQYLDLYRMNDNSKIRLLSYEFLDHGRHEQTMDSVARTWALSFEWIRKNHAEAADILCLMCFYQHHSVPEKLLRHEDGDMFEFEDSIAILQTFSLLERNELGSSYNTHRLIQIITKWWLGREGPQELEAWALRALELVTLQFPSDIPDKLDEEDGYWEDCQNLLPHAEIVLHHKFMPTAREASLEKARLLAHTGRYTSWTGDWQDTHAHFKKSLNIRQDYLGPKHVDTLESMGLVLWSLPAVSSFTGEHLPNIDGQTPAEFGYMLLELRREVLGPHHRDTIEGMSDLATLLRQQRHFEESVALQREALALSKEIYGLEDEDTSNYMAALAAVLGAMQENVEAVEVATEAVMIKTKLLGPEHRISLVTRGCLGLYLEKAGRADEALEIYRQVYTSQRRVLGDEHMQTLDTAKLLAMVLVDTQRFKEAIEILSQVLNSTEVRKRTYTEIQLSFVKEFVELKQNYERAEQILKV